LVEEHPRPHELMLYMVMKEGSAYGYQLAARFRKMTGGHIKISYGTIYPLLRKMERRGLIRSRKDEKSGRIYYELTSEGLEAGKKLSAHMKECQRDSEEKLLGILHMHLEVFGRKALKDLLARANRIG